MNSKSPSDIYTLTDYLVGELDIEQNSRVEGEMLRDAECRDLVSRLQVAQDALRDPMHSHVNIDTISKSLLARIGGESVLSGAPVLANKRATSWRRFGLMLSAAAVLTVAFWGYSERATDVGDSILASQTIYTTPAGERATIRLIDGTQVVLNVGSTLMIPADFGKSNRTLTLNGEALFSVVQHTEAPFIVSAGNTVSKVLGTTFGVRAYESDSIVRVVVQDGRVMTNNTVISPNEVVEIEHNGKSRVLHEVPVANYIAFATGTLVFTDVALSEAIPSLNRWFNAEIIVADERLSSKLLTATYGKGSISDLAEYLSVTFNANVVREGRRLILHSR